MAVVKELDAARKIYLHDDGTLLNIGETLRNPSMGRLYQRIADEGIGVFYNGEDC